MNAEIDISGVVLKTERLILREFKEDDLDDFYEYAKVDGVGQMAGWNPHENKEKSMMILKDFIEEKKTFALQYNNKVIGSLGIEKDNHLTELTDLIGRELGFVLSKDYWGQGIMKEAVDKVIDYCFCTLDLDYLSCGHFLENNQSRRVQEKCGFKMIKKVIFTTRMGIKKEGYLSIIFNPKNNIDISTYFKEQI